MHIAFVTPSYVPVPGGGERYVAALARELAAAGHRVSVVTSMAAREADFWSGQQGANLEAIAETPGVTVWRSPIMPMPGGRRGLLLWRKAMVLISALPGDQTAILSRMANRVPCLTGYEDNLAALGQVDLVHAFNVSWEGAIVAGHRYAHERQLPLVVTPFAHFGSGPDDRVALNSTMEHQMRILADAAEVMVLTAAEEIGLVRRGLPSEKLRVIGGGLDELPRPEDAAVPELIAGQTIPARYALFLGRASFDKGAIHAAEAVRQLRQAGEEVNVVLAGSSTDDFDRYYRGLPAAEQAGILPLGVVAEGQKAQLLSHAAVLLLPSRSESLGLTILEAWAYGRPVIGAQAGSIPHVVANGHDGLLVPFGDVDGLASAIRAVWTDEALGTRLGERGRAKVGEQYNWAAVTGRVLSGYEAILSREPALAGPY